MKKVLTLDLITLSEHLELREQLEEVGGLHTLPTLLKKYPKCGEHKHADIVAQRALVRSLIGVAMRLPILVMTLKTYIGRAR
ncbi:hypothetical protein O9992_10735 [Vibrio lentus]|nr:hypothetical protein [Vibrio lentus]